MDGRHARVAAATLVGLTLSTTAGGQDVIYTFPGGGSAGPGLGHVVRPAGDVDGDGVVDVIAGYRTGSSAAGTGTGTARVWSGADGSILWTFVGTGPQQQFGRSAAGAGDVNGDGHADLIVGAAGADIAGQDVGFARVYSGVDGALLHDLVGPFALARFGTSVTGLGDIDGDGRGDFAISGQPAAGASQPAGFVRVYSGATGALIRAHVGASAQSRLGCAIADAGDVDGDGVHDLVAGDWRDATGGTAAGAVRVFSGATGAELLAVFGTLANGNLGSSVAGAGDVDGDGRADVIGGAPLGGPGYARVWSGATGAVLLSVTGDAVNDQFGIAVAGLGDVDGDGRDDLGVGASSDDDGGTNSGSVRVYAGVDGAELFRFDGNSTSDELGFSLCALGDLDGDGGLDFAVAAPGDDAGGGALSGAVRVHRGIPPPPTGPQNYCTTSPNSAGPGALMGWSGSTSIAAGDLALVVSGAPPHTVGLFLYGATQASQPAFQGTLCIAPPLRRLPPPVLTSRTGSAQRDLRRGAAWRTDPIVAGTTWCFQFVYFDKLPGKARRCGRAFNFSDGLSVTFTP